MIPKLLGHSIVIKHVSHYGSNVPRPSSAVENDSIDRPKENTPKRHTIMRQEMQPRTTTTSSRRALQRHKFRLADRINTHAPQTSLLGRIHGVYRVILRYQATPVFDRSRRHPHPTKAHLDVAEGASMRAVRRQTQRWIRSLRSSRSTWLCWSRGRSLHVQKIECEEWVSGLVFVVG